MREFLYNVATDRYNGPAAGLFKCALFLLSLVYGLVIRFLIGIYAIRRAKADCVCISVGNITLGGTGKTCLVEYIARYLSERGHKVAVLSRGYKLGAAKPQSSSTKIGGPAKIFGGHKVASSIVGDEPLMLQQNLSGVPVIVDADRLRGIDKAIKDHSADTVILDDGFQQWKIRKDLDIVAIDCTNPFGNRHMMPRGILREPLSSLKRADVLVLTKTNLTHKTQGIKKSLAGINPGALIIESVHRAQGLYPWGEAGKMTSVSVLKEKNVCLFSGIADPDSFQNTMEGLGANIVFSYRFPDHYEYLAQDLENLAGEAERKKADMIVTTEKDAARIAQSGIGVSVKNLFILKIGIEFTEKRDSFHDRLSGLYHT